jgi:hypothetical protein
MSSHEEPGKGDTGRRGPGARKRRVGRGRIPPRPTAGRRRPAGSPGSGPAHLAERPGPGLAGPGPAVPHLGGAPVRPVSRRLLPARRPQPARGLPVGPDHRHLPQLADQQLHHPGQRRQHGPGGPLRRRRRPGRGRPRHPPVPAAGRRPRAPGQRGRPGGGGRAGRAVTIARPRGRVCRRLPPADVLAARLSSDRDGRRRLPDRRRRHAHGAVRVGWGDFDQPAVGLGPVPGPGAIAGARVRRHLPGHRPEPPPGGRGRAAGPGPGAGQGCG